METVGPEQFAEDIRQHVGHFKVNEALSLGNYDSQHQVFFGEMPDVSDDLVAVKSFTKNARARNEMHSLNEVASRGIEAIEPITVVMGGLRSYLITRYQRGLTHLGMVDWRTNVADQKLDRVLLPTLVQGAVTLAEWHNKGVAHGDSQIKNMMYKPSGAAVFGDAERSSFHPYPVDFTPAANKDVFKLGRSVLSRGFLYDKSAAYRVGYLEDTLLSAYLDTVNPTKTNQTDDERKAIITDYWTSAITAREDRLRSKVSQSS